MQEEKITAELTENTTAQPAAEANSQVSAAGQTQDELLKGRQRNYASDPGPANQPIVYDNPSSHTPPFMDHGNMEPIWYSAKAISFCSAGCL